MLPTHSTKLGSVTLALGGLHYSNYATSAPLNDPELVC